LHELARISPKIRAETLFYPSERPVFATNTLICLTQPIYTPAGDTKRPGKRVELAAAGRCLAANGKAGRRVLIGINTPATPRYLMAPIHLWCDIVGHLFTNQGGQNEAEIVRHLPRLASSCLVGQKVWCIFGALRTCEKLSFYKAGGYSGPPPRCPRECREFESHRAELRQLHGQFQALMAPAIKRADARVLPSGG